MKPILCLVAVGDKYTTYISPSTKEFLEKEYRICLLTDNKSLNGFFDIEIYDKAEFTYFSKLNFPIEMALKHGCGVFYCDVNKLHELNELNVWYSNRFTYLREWPIATYFREMENEPYWSQLVSYWNDIYYDYGDLTTIEEHVYYFPYTLELKCLLLTLREVQPIFEQMSRENITPYNGIGNGEGLALAYAIDICKI